MEAERYLRYGCVQARRDKDERNAFVSWKSVAGPLWLQRAMGNSKRQLSQDTGVGRSANTLEVRSPKSWRKLFLRGGSIHEKWYFKSGK